MRLRARPVDMLTIGVRAAAEAAAVEVEEGGGGGGKSLRAALRRALSLPCPWPQITAPPPPQREA
jgi:hypothetical protein